MGESGPKTPLSDAEVAEAYEEEMKGPQGVSFVLRGDHLLARAHRALMLEALRETRDMAHWEEWAMDRLRTGLRNDRETYRAEVISAAIKAATGGET